MWASAALSSYAAWSLRGQALRPSKTNTQICPRTNKVDAGVLLEIAQEAEFIRISPDKPV